MTITDPYQQLLDLAECLLYRPDRQVLFEGGKGTRPRLLAGKVPDDLDLELPFPEDAEILGSLVRSPLDIAIVLRTGLRSEEVDDFYRDRLAAQGWEPPPESLRGGFEENVLRPSRGVLLASPERGIRLLVNHGPSESGERNAVIIRIFSEPRPRPEGAGITSPVPELKAPPGSSQVSHGSDISGNAEYARSYREVASINYAANPADHFHRQLERAGWKLEREASLPGGISSHSIWTFRDDRGDTWDGVLMVVEKCKVPRRYTAYMEAHWRARNLLRRRKGGT